MPEGAVGQPVLEQDFANHLTLHTVPHRVQTVTDDHFVYKNSIQTQHITSTTDVEYEDSL
jgi:hypothetical protein